MTQPEPFEPTEAICDEVQTFLDAVIDQQPWHTGETFHICRLCGEADSHADGCPVPAVLAWQSGGPSDQQACAECGGRGYVDVGDGLVAESCQKCEPR